MTTGLANCCRLLLTSLLWAGGETAQRITMGGFQSRFAVRGACQVTLNYELTDIRQPNRGSGAGVLLRIVDGENDQHAVTLGHVRLPSGDVVYYVSSRHVDGSSYKTFPAGQGRSTMQLRHLGDGRFAMHAGPGTGTPSQLMEVEGFNLNADAIIDIFATAGGATTPIKAKVTAIRVTADDMPMGEVAATDPPFPWHDVGLSGAVVAAAGWWLRARRASA